MTTKYEDKINRAYLCLKAATQTSDSVMKKMWYANYQSLVDSALNMPIEEAEEIIGESDRDPMLSVAAWGMAIVLGCAVLSAIWAALKW